AVTGARVTRVRVLDERSLRRHPGPSDDFMHRLTGATLAYPSRRGKYLWLPFRGAAGAATPGRELFPPPEGHGSSRAVYPEGVVVHLGMSGQVLLRDPDAEIAKLTRIVIDVDAPGHGPVRLDFVDQRIFGSMALDELVPAPDRPEERLPASVAHIARDPLDPSAEPRSSPPSTTGRASTGSRDATRPSSVRCATRPSSPASATSTPTRPFGRPASTTTSPPAR